MGWARRRQHMDWDLPLAAACAHDVNRDTPENDPGSLHMEEMGPGYRVFWRKFPVLAAQSGGAAVSGIQAHWWPEAERVEGAMKLDCVRNNHHRSAGSQEAHSRRWGYMELAMKRARLRLGYLGDEASFVPAACIPSELVGALERYLVSFGVRVPQETIASGKRA